MSKPIKRNVNVKKRNNMGIGPQNLGAAGGSSKCKPCGSPLKKSPFMKMEDLSGDGKITQKDVLIGRGVIDKKGDKKPSALKKHCF